MCDGSSGDTCNKLGRDDQKGSEGLDSSNEEETERDSWVKHAAGNAVEDPDIDSESTAEGGRDVHQAEGEERPVREPRVIGDDGCLSTDERQQQEHEGATELSEDDGEGVSECVRDNMLSFALLEDRVGPDIEDGAKLGSHGDGSDGKTGMRTVA